MRANSVKCTSKAFALLAVAACLLSSCGTQGGGPSGAASCAPGSLVAISPHSVDSSSRLVDGSLESNLGLTRWAFVGTVREAQVDDEDGRGLRDGRVTLDDLELTWRNPATTKEQPRERLVADYLATSQDDDASQICVGDRVLVLLTEPAGETSEPPAYLAQAAYRLTDGTVAAGYEATSGSTSLSGVGEDDLATALGRAADNIPEPLSRVVDLPMEERLAALEGLEGEG